VIDLAPLCLPKLLDEHPTRPKLVAVTYHQHCHRQLTRETASTPKMGAQKRKRSDLAEDGQDGNSGARPVYKTYKTGKEIQSAVEFGSKECKHKFKLVLNVLLFLTLLLCSSQCDKQPNPNSPFTTTGSNHASKCGFGSALPGSFTQTRRGVSRLEKCCRGTLP
jgi:hypothetical protein